MPDIKNYNFGEVCISGESLTSDFIIHPSGAIHKNWWRKNGHFLELSDIQSLVDESPEIIIVGTGASGLMKISAELEPLLHGLNIKIIASPTQEAINLYTEKIQTDAKIGACFHLTC